MLINTGKCIYYIEKQYAQNGKIWKLGSRIGEVIYFAYKKEVSCVSVEILTYFTLENLI